MNKNIVYGGILIAILLAVGGYFFPQIQSAFGATGTRFPNGISADTTSPMSGQVRGTTFTSTGLATLASATVTGTLTQSTTNAATTTAAVGCIQTTATSTATPVKLVVTSISTTTTSFSSITSGFEVIAAYGNCP